MRRGDCPAVFSLEILRRNPCTGEESAPRETGRGTRQLFEQMDTAFCSRNTFAPRNGIFIQIPQGLARRGNLRTRTPQGDGCFDRFRSMSASFMKFKNQNPARGRMCKSWRNDIINCRNLRTRTPQGDGSENKSSALLPKIPNLRTRTPQGDGSLLPVPQRPPLREKFKNQNPARGRNFILRDSQQVGRRVI